LSLTLVGTATLSAVTSVPAGAATPCGAHGSFAVTGSVVTCTYSTVGKATFTVPENDNVTSVTVVVIGGGGGGGQSDTNGTHDPRTGGSGAKVTTTLTGLAATETLPVVVGGGGSPSIGNPSSGGGGASSVDAGDTNQVIAGGGGGGGNTTKGGNAGAAGTNYTGCTAGGGGAGGGGHGGAGGKSTHCSTPTGTAPSGGTGNGGHGGAGRDGGSTPIPGGFGTGSGVGGTSNTFSGAGGGGYGGGGGGTAGSGGGGGGSTGTASLAGNGGKGEATPTTTPWTPAKDNAMAGGNGSVAISYTLPTKPKNITPPTMSFTGATGTHATCTTTAADWTSSVPITEYRYEWLKDTTTVLSGPNVTTPHYTITRAANAGSSLTCAVSASNISGPSTPFTGSNSQGFAAVPTNITPPTLSTGGFVGEAMVCGTVPADWTHTPFSFQYQFLATGAPLGPYSSDNTFTITATLAGKVLSCRVEAFNAPWPSTPVDSSNSIPAVQALTVTAPSPTVPYGSPVPALTPAYTGLLPGTVLPETQPTCTTTPPKPTQAGTYPVTCAGGVDARYAFTYVAGKLKITPVPLTITAPSPTVVTGKAVPTLTPTYTGFVAADTPASLKTPPVCTTTYVPGGFPLPTPGPYPVTCSGAVDSNYTISYVPGTLTVSSTYIPGAYVLADANGDVYALNNPHGFHGSLPGIGISVSDIVAVVPSADNKGYWLIGGDGGVFAFGDAVFHGSLPEIGISVSDIVGAVATPDGGGYWLVGRDGGVFAFGDAKFRGSLPAKGVSTSGVTGIAATPTGGGYWLANASGAVDPFSAPTLGGPTGQNIVGITATAAGEGYWLVGATGGVFCEGNAPFRGSLPGVGVQTSDAVSLVASDTGYGYLVTGADGSTYAFPNAVFPGPLPGVPAAPVIGAAPSA
jgi:hypothetical protein